MVDVCKGGRRRRYDRLSGCTLSWMASGKRAPSGKTQIGVSLEKVVGGFGHLRHIDLVIPFLQHETSIERQIDH